MNCPYCNEVCPDNAVFCRYCGASLVKSTPMPTQPAQNTVIHHPDYPLKWYYFLIYFSLFAAAIMNAITGVQYLTGTAYISEGLSAADMDLVYSLFPALSVIDRIYGLVCIALGVLAIVTRSHLARYKATGPKLLYTLYACNGVIPFLYTCIAYSAIPGAELTAVLPTAIGSAVGQGILLFMNYTYFSKRKALFEY